MSVLEQFELSGHKLETVEVMPEILSVNVGSLSIESTPRENGKPVAGCHAKVLLDGKPLRARRVVLVVDVNEVIKATIEHYI